MNWQAEITALRHAYGEPVLQGVFKQSPEDFQVEEQLGFQPDGAGEHEFLWLEKTGLTTTDVQMQLAHCYRLPVQRVSFSGMKDRQGITRQWFSVHEGTSKPLKQAEIGIEGVKVLQRCRNSRKLQRGSHKANRFVMRIHACNAVAGDWQQRLQQIRQRGVPNYFGQQRFGWGADNLQQATRWFTGEVPAPKSRTRRSMLLSSARSLVFNAVLSERIASGSWDRILPGEVVALNGSASTFAESQATTAEMQQRLDEFDIHPTGPLWGAGDTRTSGAVAELETAVAGRFADLTAGLQQHGLQQERRALRLQVADLQADLRADVLVLSFMLTRGAYATSVLREFLQPESR
jgi:tRNA pseudouridine13 synthase